MISIPDGVVNNILVQLPQLFRNNLGQYFNERLLLQLVIYIKLSMFNAFDSAP
jgi:hypothetical protein